MSTTIREMLKDTADAAGTGAKPEIPIAGFSRDVILGVLTCVDAWCDDAASACDDGVAGAGAGAGAGKAGALPQPPAQEQPTGVGRPQRQNRKCCGICRTARTTKWHAYKGGFRCNGVGCFEPNAVPDPKAKAGAEAGEGGGKKKRRKMATQPATTKMPESLTELSMMGIKGRGDHWRGPGSDYILQLIECTHFLDMPELMISILTIVGKEISALAIAEQRMKRLSQTATPGKSCMYQARVK